ncbi:MAG TPA: DUF3501 family protein [Polyangiaceae bacterium]
MKLIERGEVLGLAEYEAIREQFRARVVADKKRTRVELGPKASVVFENRDTVLMQIQEMLRTERITRPAAVQHEIDTYNELLPGDREISCTLMIEIADKDEREAFLHAAKGLEKHVWLVSGSQRIAACGGDRGGDADRTTAVHYLKFSLPERLADALRGAVSGSATLTHLELAVDHPAYSVSAVLPAETILRLGEDLDA